MTLLEELLAWSCASQDGHWTVDVYLFRSKPKGEARFYYDGQLAFAEPLGIAEIAMFASHRADLIDAWLAARSHPTKQ